MSQPVNPPPAAPQPTPPAPAAVQTVRRRGSNIALIGGVVLVLVAIAAGVYFGFFAKPGTPEMTAIGETSLIDQPGPVTDLEAYLDRVITPEQKALMSYRVEGNRMLDVTVTEPDGRKLTADAIEFKALDTAHDQPHFVDLRIKGMEITLPADAMAGSLGPIKGEMIYAYHYDEAAHTLEVPAVQMILRGVATIGFTGSFSDVTLFGATPEAAMDGLASGKVKAFTFQLADETLLTQMLEQTAKSQGMDLAAMKTQGIAMLTILEGQVTGSIEKQALAAARTILTKDGAVTLTVTANPAEPFALAQFLLVGQGSGGMPDLSALEPLNVTITAE